MVLMVIKNGNVALRFLLELCVLVALGYWGFQTGQGLFAKIGLGIGTPLVAAVVWGLLGAPGSSWQLHDPWHLVRLCCKNSERNAMGRRLPVLAQLRLPLQTDRR